MNYEMEELLPIVGKLAGQYTSNESGSVTYETANQLMSAVIYCIRETEVQHEMSLQPKTSCSAKQAYETGYALARQKVKQALCLYNEITQEFESYGNQCIKDVIQTGMPEFFKWYDLKFNPQNEIITLDYPVLKDLSEFEGIDKIYEYLICIQIEQQFLSQLPKEFVERALKSQGIPARDQMDNLCETVISFIIDNSKMQQISENDCVKTSSLQEYLKPALQNARYRRAHREEPC